LVRGRKVTAEWQLAFGGERLRRGLLRTKMAGECDAR